MTGSKEVRKVVTFGEGLLRMSPPGTERLAASRSLDVFPGGSEANVAAGIATLGGQARFFTQLPSNPLADILLAALRTCNVDVSTVLRTDGRLGTYYLEQGAGVRTSRVIYDRADSTFVELASEDLTDDVLNSVFDGAGWLHTSGINLAVKRAPVDVMTTMWMHAGERGVHRSFDLNMRATLPEAHALKMRARPFLETADVVFIAERDARALTCTSDASFDDTLTALRSHAPTADLFVTRGGRGAMAEATTGERAAASALPVEDLGRIGRGDAFAAGVLHVLSQRDVHCRASIPEALAWGVASASYKSTLPGDLPVLDPRAIETLVRCESMHDVQR